MINHEVRRSLSSARLAREEQLAWKLAAVATDPVEVLAEVAEMVVNRVIDNAAVAAAALGREPVRAAREQALRHAAAPGAAVWGAAEDVRVSRSGRRGRTGSRSVSWISMTRSWPPTTRIRGTTSRRCWRSPSTAAGPGRDVVRGIAAAYEVQVDLVRGICLHEHRIDHIAHLGPSAAAGIGSAAGTGHAGRVSGDRAGAACTTTDPAVP